MTAPPSESASAMIGSDLAERSDWLQLRCRQWRRVVQLRLRRKEPRPQLRLRLPPSPLPPRSEQPPVTSDSFASPAGSKWPSSPRSEQPTASRLFAWWRSVSPPERWSLQLKDAGRLPPLWRLCAPARCESPWQWRALWEANRLPAMRSLLSLRWLSTFPERRLLGLRDVTCWPYSW